MKGIIIFGKKTLPRIDLLGHHSYRGGHFWEFVEKFSVKLIRKEENQQKQSQATDARPEGVVKMDKDQEVPVSNLIGIEVHFGPRDDGDILNEIDKELLRENAFPTAKAIWPDYFKAVIEFRRDAEFGTVFTSSFNESVDYSERKANELNAHFVLQTLYPRLHHPTKGEWDCRATLIVYLRPTPSQQKTVLLIAPNHRIVPIL